MGKNICEKVLLDICKNVIGTQIPESHVPAILHYYKHTNTNNNSMWLRVAAL